jgi:hypothetical protein
MIWYLIFLFWGGGTTPTQAVILPATSATACDAARTGLKWAPATAASTSAATSSWGSASGATGTVVGAFCLQGDITVIRAAFPAPTPPPSTTPAP